MRYVISRRSVRGFPLDDDCRSAGIIREADGQGDPRRYCSGYTNPITGETKPDCVTCKAHIDNVTPWKGERNGVLPGQISIEEYLHERERERT